VNFLYKSNSGLDKISFLWYNLHTLKYFSHQNLRKAMTAIPMLQVALDYISLPPALAMALQVADEVDIIEIGTPLCKAAGLEAIRAVREVCPDKFILADLKSPDVGGLEAKMAFDAGADMMTVIGGAALATVESALRVAQDMGKEMLMELTGVRDIIARAEEWRDIGVERMVYHRGWDEQAFDRQWAPEDLVVIRQLIDMGFKVTVTGGITLKLLPFFQSLPVSIIIVGREIHQAQDPAASAHQIRAEIHRLWGGEVTAGISFVDRAAKAIRFGVSDMGLLLTVDGRDCPGCDSPERFCQSTRTSIHCPSGVNAGDLVQAIGRFYGQGDAFGRESSEVFFLDPARIPNLSGSRVIDLLRATGNALQQLGAQVDVSAGVAAADQVLGR
jgi:3-dehydro-L-gulonate-6-phosphate decarboxylase